MPNFVFTPIEHDPFDTKPAMQYAAELGGAPDHKVFDETLANVAGLPQRWLGDPLEYVGKGLLGQTSVPIGPKGEIDSIDPNLVDAANALGGFAMEGGLAMPRPEGSLGMLGGVRAKTADFDALQRAHEMEQSGIHPDAIWKKTGWGRGKDGKWRFEIPDHAAKYDSNLLQDVKPGKQQLFMDLTDEYARKLGKNDFFGLTDKEAQEAESYARRQIGEEISLGQAYDHPELYRAYPGTKNMNVVPNMDEGSSGYYEPVRNELGISSRRQMIESGDHRAANPASIIAHEVQHGIQSREDFGMGGSSADPQLQFIGSNNRAMLLSRIRELESAQISGSIERSPEELFYLKNLYRRIADSSPGQVGYHTLAGEVEARNVETRLNQRVNALTPPWDTEDVPRDYQHVRIIDNWRKGSNE